ncbi:MAG TPA: diguanylate cyclase [Candidatus Acidoferrum sp.]|jgi:diguanylate cyclase (GGDEF)-like protein/PAS domain S-box-containing protein|nr:diguanylate cyclase [Candidatus Acidoferrum sp.]
MPAFQDPETYRDILNGLQIGVSVLDMEKRIVFWSDGAEQITGYARIDVLGHSCAENILLHCNQTSCEMCNEKCPIAGALHDGKPVEGANFIHHKSGHRTPVHTWAIPLRDKHGSIIGVIQTFEGECAVNGPNPNDRSMKEHGWLDDTTGLPNPAMMHSHLRETLGTFAEIQIPFGVVCLKLHELSQFRARYGQEAATSMLVVLARTLRNAVWPTDFVGRWSEGRFLVILVGCGEDAMQTISDRMLKLMASATIDWWGEELSVAVSMGRTVAVAGDTIESLVERAHLALGADQVSPPGRAAAAANSSSTV